MKLSLLCGRCWVLVVAALAAGLRLGAATYEVGPGRPYAAIGDVPWEALGPGDQVWIHWRSTPYREKWVIGRSGTASAPLVVSGVPGPNGELPVIEGAGATTRLALDYWSEGRGILKIGGTSIPADVVPAHVVVENLDLRGARSGNTFTDDAGVVQSYPANAAALYLEKGENITIRNCRMHDCGNGLFIASSDAVASRNILVEANHIFDNGNVGSAFEHNSYTAGLGVTFQFNRYGPLRSGAVGNALKDRSAGLTVRYNWIEGGNRQLDLVNGEDSLLIRNDPAYRTTHVYGNVLIENAGTDNRQIVHYGGDTGASTGWRKGVMHFYHNTVVSHRTDRTTLFRLSSNDERSDARNNVIHLSAAAGSTLALIEDTGVIDWGRNWAKSGWVYSFFGHSGTINDAGMTLSGLDPGFVDLAGQDLAPATGAAMRDAGGVLNPAVLPVHAVTHQYVRHLDGEARPADGAPDLGALEAGAGSPPPLVLSTTTLPTCRLGEPYSAPLPASGGTPPYQWTLAAGVLPSGLGLDPATGEIRGTPTAVQTATFTVAVTDSQVPAALAQRTFTLPVAAPLVIQTTALASARRTRAYSQTLQASGGVVPYRWGLVAGALPPGLGLNASTGVISGKPTTAGTWSFVVRVIDAGGPAAFDDQALSILVNR